ncbi:hypothetical protein Gotur_032456 [Gossypium turneri]
MVRRGFVQELTCGVCGHVFEDILHVLRNCTTARSICDRLIPTKWHTRFYVNSLQDWLVLNLQNQQKWHLGDVEWQNLFGVIAWRFWKNCNLFIFQDASWKANDIIKISYSWAKQFISLNRNSTINSQDSNLWSHVDGNWACLYTDGSVQNDGNILNGLALLHDRGYDRVLILFDNLEGYKLFGRRC